jgi:hypothetical protein
MRVRFQLKTETTAARSIIFAKRTVGNGEPRARTPR